ncbi:MAG TPA: hypothetical protein VLE48_15135 [Terriglobales bacterium]|nr:hypothetical protein [Terriglobales bacterium]
MRTLKALIGLAVVVAGIYLAYRLIPPYFANFQLEDAIESEARLGSYSNKSEAEIVDIVLKKARDLDIPLRAEQVHVLRDSNGLTIWAEYTVHVDLPGRPVDLKFRPSTSNKAQTGARF